MRQAVMIPRFAVSSRAVCECKRVEIDMEYKTAVVTWCVRPGEWVKKGDVLCEAEVEKSVIEVLAPLDGQLTEICAPDGTACDIRHAIGFLKAG